MVFRGSSIKPDANVVQAYDALIEAQRNLEGAQQQLLPSAATNPSHLPLWQTRCTEAREAGSPDLSEQQVRNGLKELADHNAKLLGLIRKAQAVDDTDLQFRQTLLQFVAGGVAGIVARSVVAPIDRVKILMQTQHVMAAQRGASAIKYHGLMQSLRTIVAEEGVKGLWRSNLANIIRVAPYSATQFASYDYYKAYLGIGGPGQQKGKLEQLQQRLLCGGLAGLTATTVTHPLDVVRLRVATDMEIRGATDAFVQLIREGGFKNLYRGYLPTVVSLCPFIAVNFATFDTLKSAIYPDGKPGIAGTLALGASSGLIAQSVCHPLDTIRRRLQMKGQVYSGMTDCVTKIAREEGLQGFYRGVVPNAVKIVPNNSIRFLVFSMMKDLLLEDQEITFFSSATKERIQNVFSFNRTLF